MTADSLGRYQETLTRIFSMQAEGREAHLESRAVLSEMIQDPDFLPALVRRHLSQPQNYNRPNFPLPGMAVAETPFYTCYAHFWFGGMPQRRRGQSVTCVHHHGALLLTTIAASGPGCEVWMFSGPRATGREGVFEIKSLGRHQNTFGSYTFVDAGEAHLIFPPASFSITIALWSRHHANRLVQSLKYHPFIQRNKKYLLQMARRFRMTDALQINEVVNFDFVPLETGFRACPDRLQYPYAANEDYLVNLFHILKTTRNENQIPVILKCLDRWGSRVKNEPLIRELIQKMERGEAMAGTVSASHQFVRGLNVTRDEVLRALGRSAVLVPEGVAR